MIGTDAIDVVMLPTSNASEMPAIVEPFASAGSESVRFAGDAGSIDKEGIDGALVCPPPPQPDNNVKPAATKSARRTLVS